MLVFSFQILGGIGNKTGIRLHLGIGGQSGGLNSSDTRPVVSIVILDSVAGLLKISSLP